jgi:hypothetical protein
LYRIELRVHVTRRDLKDFGIVLASKGSMRTMIIIGAAVSFMVVFLCQNVLSQNTYRATANISATVIASTSMELRPSEATLKTNLPTSLSLIMQGTGNVLVTVDTKEMRVSRVIPLAVEQGTFVNIPHSKSSKISIAYLSS